MALVRDTHKVVYVALRSLPLFNPRPLNYKHDAPVSLIQKPFMTDTAIGQGLCPYLEAEVCGLSHHYQSSTNFIIHHHTLRRLNPLS